MKKATILVLVIMQFVFGFSQSRVNVKKEFRSLSSISVASVLETQNLSKETVNSQEKDIEAEIIGSTFYDLQTNTSMQSRIFLYPDGSIGGAFTYGYDFSSFPERGTGYNYYDGSEWGPYPTQRIENDRTGWPSYNPWGQTGELVVAHYSGAPVEGLAISKRLVKGTGNWTSMDLFPPAGATGLAWPRSATGGANYSIIHTIALTTPIGNGGTIYQGQDGALLYSRSNNGGNTWEEENIIIEEIDSDFYNGFTADTYDIIAEGNNVAILVGDDWTDLILLKSTDNGITWDKTVIWEHPYPLFDHNNLSVTDTFYCADGSHSLAFDNEGKVHIAFGINRAICDGSTEYWFPGVGGIAYWNEDRPTFSNNLNALCPYSDCTYSELIEDYSLIGWTQDINNNGEIDIIWDDIAFYYMGLSSMPQLVIDEQNNIFLIYSSVTETYQASNQNYRHLWARGFNANNQIWGNFVDLNGDLIYYFSECVFPSCSPNSDGSIHLIYQRDTEPGLAVRGDLDPHEENYIEYMNIPKTDIINISSLGNLTGTVTELNGGYPVSGATILVQGTSYSTTSSYNGTYSINGIPSGSYTVICNKFGYLNVTAYFTIQEDVTTTLDFQLEEIVIPENGQIGNTYYDLQSNYSMQNRICRFPDGTFGATFTYGMNYPGFLDRRTGYNYFNGSSWLGAETIESYRTGWPSYAPWGVNGEIIVAHYWDSSMEGLAISSRPVKGTGNWAESNFYGPAGFGGYAWPRATTGGVVNSDLHIIAMTKPVSYGGAIYQGLDGALLYSRSPDGGLSWDIESFLPDEINSNFYVGFTPDTYEIIAQDDNVAFLIGGPWTDLILMKSTDNGNTWNKSIIWEHPYPMFDPNYPMPTDTFYCVDGAHSLTFDNTGKIHVAFGINRTYNDGTGSYWFPGVGGIGYWNEDMPSFSNNLNALSPYGDTGSELIQNYNYVGWWQDVNGNGQQDILDNWGDYNIGFSSMPQLVTDEENNIFLVYSSVTEGYDNTIQNYRHLWARGFINTTQVWGDFVDLNTDIQYVFSECVFPSLSPSVDDNLHLIFQEDTEPGMAVKGDEDPYGENFIIYMSIPTADLLMNSNTGNLEGVITALNGGEPIVDAIISVQGTSLSAITDSNGYYAIDNIPVGSYNVICSKSGYINESAYVTISENLTTIQNFILEEVSVPPNEIIGETYYDLQSNSSMPGRIYKHSDGTIGATYTFGLNFPSFPDRGTGYNYFDGTSWGPIPEVRIESDRSGWPSYAPWGSHGEIVVAHYSGAANEGLVISSRSNKGTGVWAETDFYGPPSSGGYLWPRATTGGTDHTDLHVIALTMPVSNGGSIYQGMDGALLYSRSPDGGQTWDIENFLPDEINANFYKGFAGDAYDIIAKDNNIAFLVGDEWTDLVLMNSTDNGNTWVKTIIWEHPYPMFDQNNMIPTDTFYCVDGAHSLAFDNTGKIHVTFGITRTFCDGYYLTVFPHVDGIGYWNEDMPSYSNNMNALSPYGDTGSELIQDYNLIGWSQDINGNGELDILDDWGQYYLGFSSMPQLVIDEMNNIFLVYSSVTETYESPTQNYRHLWARGSNDNGQTWGEFVDLNSDLIYIFSECVFPSISPTSDDYLYLIFQKDNEPGLAVRGDEDPYEENQFEFKSILKTDIVDIQPGGILEGTVTDALSSLPIENAVVSLSGTSYFTQTGSDGTYGIYNIPVGDYTAICSKMGYLYDTVQITIEVEETTIQDFELEEAGNLEPPTNLWADVDDNNVTLYWEEPLTDDLLGYNVYRNEMWIAYLNANTYLDENLSPDTFEYFVTAVYDVGESLPSNIVEVEIFQALNPPENLAATVVENNVHLIWDVPGGGGNSDCWIQWDNGINTGNAIGLLDGGTFYAASHWTPDELLPYEGMTITKIAFFPSEDPSATFSLAAWTGENAGTLIMSQAVESYVVDETNEITLTNPILIDATDELWFGYAVTHENYTHPAGCDDGPAVQYKGDMVSFDGYTWGSLYELTNGSLDFNFNISAYVIETDDSSEPAKPITRSISNNSNNIFEPVLRNETSEKVFKKFTPSDSKALQGYNVYRDSLFIDYTSSISYLDEDLSPGSYEYYVTAVYDEGESVSSNTVEVFCPFASPVDLVATLFDENNVHIEWEQPAWGDPLSYNLYRDYYLIGNYIGLSADDLNLPPGTYYYCVTAVYEDGESDCSEIITVTIDNIVAPENFTAVISGVDVLCSWDAVDSKDFLGYRVFRNENDISGLISYTEYLDIDPPMGTYDYYVAAEYDGGLSNPSNSVNIILTGIENSSLNQVQIFPNPAKDFVIVKSDSEFKSIKVFNHTGQIVIDKIVEDINYRINTSQLRPGLYLFKIENKNGIISKRIIIE